MAQRIVSKRLNKSKIISKTGVEVTLIYCRKCMEMKKPADFYQASDRWLDSNGYFSVCKDCCNALYQKMYATERNLERALLRTCRILNLKYDPNAIEATKIHLKTMSEKGRDTENILGIYKTKILSVLKVAKGDSNDNQDLTFVEPGESLPDPVNDDDGPDAIDLKQFWGDNFNWDQFTFLERELADWKKTHKCDTKAEESLLKELCIKELEIRQTRVEGKSVGSLVKEKQELMKTASVDPAKTALAGSGKSQDTFSAFIKTIEENSPAEYYQDKKLFKDFDNIVLYFKNFLVRPLKNFITNSRDFNLADDVEDEDEDFSDIEEGE